MEKIKESIHNDFEKLKLDKEQYFSEFYSNNYNLVYKICFSILKDKDNTEDVTQNIFEKIYKLPNDKLATEYESTWLYTVAKNESLQYIRKNKINTSVDEQIGEFASADNEIDNIIDQEQYDKLVKKLNKKEGQIISLKVLSDFTFKEIGEILSIPTPTVQWYYYKSIKSLKVAISNLAMFIITFVIGLKLKTNSKSEVDIEYIKDFNVSDKDKTNMEDSGFEINQESSSEITSTDTNEDKPSNIKNILGENESITTEIVTDSNVDTSSKSNNYIGVFCIAGVFLIISIIFSIIFIKHQQKTKNKSSK